MQNNSKALQTIDQSTGEVVPYQEEIDPTEVIPGAAMAHLMDPFRKGSPLPVHIQMLEEGNYTVVEKDDLVTAYLGAEPLRFDQVNNNTYQVLGAIIYQHPGYQGLDKLYHPEGYYQLRMLLEYQGELRVLASGATMLAMVMSYKLQRHGWWLFKEPIEFRFSKDAKGRHHIAEVVKLGSSLLKRKGQA